MAMAPVFWLIAHLLPAQSPGFDEQVRAARARLEAGALDEALEPLLEAHALRPESPDVLWMLAVAYKELGRIEDGRVYAEAFAHTAPSSASGHLMLASYLAESGDDDGALASFRRTLTLEPGHPQALHGIALTFLRRGSDAEAVAAFEGLVAAYPTDPRALVPLGVLYYGQQRLTDSMELLSRAVRVAPDASDAHHHLGILYQRLGRSTLARRHLEKALTIEPEDPATLFAIGLGLAEQEELTEARDYFERALAERPDHAETYFRLAEIHHYENDVASAERHYLRAIELDPSYAAALYHLGRLYHGASRAPEAMPRLTRALELDSELAEAHHLLAQVYDQMDDPVRAKHHFARAVDLLPFAPEPFLNYGNFLVRRGERNTGRATLEQFQRLKQQEDRARELKAAVNFDPTSPTLKRDLIEHYLLSGRVDDALAECRRFVAVATMEPIHHVLLAQVYEARGELKRARQILESANQRLPGAPEIEEQLLRLGTANP